MHQNQMDTLRKCIIKKKGQKTQTHTWFDTDKKKTLHMDGADVRQVRESLWKLVKDEGIDKVMTNTCAPKWNALSEKVDKAGNIKMFVDLDWKVDQIDKDTLSADLICILKSFNEAMDEVVGDTTQMVVAMRLPYKLHVHFPEVIVNNATAIKLFNILEGILKKSKPSLYYPKVMDISVYNTGLRMLYCHKGTLVDPEKFHEDLDQYTAKYGDTYKYCYRLVDPLTLEPLKPMYEHLGWTSIHTDATEMTELPGLAEIEMKFGTDVVAPKKRGRPPKNANTIEKVEVSDSKLENFPALVKWIEDAYEIKLNGAVKVFNANRTITFGTTGQQECPFVERSHSSNNVYMKIDDKKGVRKMCHSDDCKGKEHKIIALKDLPDDAQIEVQKSFEVVYNDHQKLEMFEKQVQATCRKEHPKNNFELNYDDADFNRNGLMAKLKDLNCLTCNKEHDDPYSFLSCNLEGHVLFKCFKQFKNSSSLTTLPPTVINNVFQGIVNLTVNNTTINNYGGETDIEERQFGDFATFPRILESDDLNMRLYRSLSGDTGDVSELIEPLINGKYIRVNNAWYRYTGIYWKKSNKGPDRFINDNVATLYKKLLSYYTDPKQVRWLTSLYKELKNSNLRQKHIEDVCSLLESDNRPSIQFDNNPYIIPFQNGIFDSKTCEFRPHAYSNYITEVIDYDFPRTVDVEMRQTILKFFEDIMENTEVRDFLLKYLALHLQGRNRHQMVAIFTGTGSNGKSMLKKLIQLTFKQFHSEQAPSFLTSEMVSSNAATANLAEIRYKFSLWSSEPPNRVKINGAFLKFISGGDEVRCRFNHANEFYEYVPRYLITLLCNSIPLIDGATDDTDAIWRRVKIIEFKTEFKEQIPEGGLKAHQKLADTGLTERMATWGPQMMLLLTEIYKDYVKSGYTLSIPLPVQMKIQEQKNENNPVREFFELCLEKSKDPNDYEHVHKIAESYREWIKVTKGHSDDTDTGKMRQHLEAAGYIVPKKNRFKAACCQIPTRAVHSYILKSWTVTG